MCARTPLAGAKEDGVRWLLSSDWTESTVGSINLLDPSAQLRRRQKSNI